MLEEALQPIIPILVLAVALELWYEYSSHRKTYRFNDTMSNLITGIFELAIGASSHLLLLFIYSLGYEYLRLISWQHPVWMGTVGFVAYEFCYYWNHRLGHEINLLWGGHVVHHQSEEMNLSIGIRLSATSPVWSILFFFPLSILGIPTLAFLSIQLVSHAYQFLMHTEHVRKYPRWLAYVLNTPSHHRVHHGTEAHYLDKNYGSSLIIWDRLFGTFQEEQEQPVYGVLSNHSGWDPLAANFGYYQKILRWLRRSRSWQDNWRILFGRPDTLPAYLAQAVDTSSDEIAKNPAPYLLPFGLRFYFFFQLVITASLAFHLIRYHARYQAWEVALLTAWSAWALSILGRLLEGKASRLRVEESLKTILLMIIMGMWLYNEWISQMAVIAYCFCLFFLLVYWWGSLSKKPLQ